MAFFFITINSSVQPLSHYYGLSCTQRAAHHHPGPAGRQQLRYTGPPIYILLALYYCCVAFNVIYVYTCKLEIHSFVISETAFCVTMYAQLEKQHILVFTCVERCLNNSSSVNTTELYRNF